MVVINNKILSICNELVLISSIIFCSITGIIKYMLFLKNKKRKKERKKKRRTIKKKSLTPPGFVFLFSLSFLLLPSFPSSHFSEEGGGNDCFIFFSFPLFFPFFFTLFFSLSLLSSSSSYSLPVSFSQSC
jgi:amino acid transporter